METGDLAVFEASRVGQGVAACFPRGGYTDPSWVCILVSVWWSWNSLPWGTLAELPWQVGLGHTVSSPILLQS